MSVIPFRVRYAITEEYFISFMLYSRYIIERRFSNGNMAMYNLELFLISVLITRLSTQRLLDIGDKWTEDEKRTSYSVMRYEFRVTCDAHYYGSGCENLCRPRDDNFGHYNCSSTGSRVCLPGWQGDYCTKRKYLQLSNHQSLNLNHIISLVSNN